VSLPRLCCFLLLLLSDGIQAQSIALISDLNGRYGNTAYNSRVNDAIETVIRMQPELVISTGDMVAGQKQPRLDQDRLDRMWAGFNLAVTDPLARAGIPFAITPGNHDGSAFPEFALERERFEAQWATRAPEIEVLPGSEWPRRYAARMGGLLLVAFDGTRPGKLPQSEFLFVEHMLQANGTAAEVTLVFSHLPMWPLAQQREHEILDDPALLELLHANGVDVYISGHHHVYFAGIDSAGMVHLSVGALGGNARKMVDHQTRQPFSFAVLDLANGQTSVRSFAAPGFTAAVPATLLPETISGPLGLLTRLNGPAPWPGIPASR
jgi:hypothetical protein